MSITQKYFELLIEQELSSILESFRGFNFPKFEKIENSIDKYKYVKNHLPKIGQGSSRAVFGLGRGKVLKLAGSFVLVDYIEKKGDLLTPEDKSAIESRLKSSFAKGIAQNKEEVDIFTNPKIKPIVAKIYNFSNDFTWLASEAVREVSEEEFEKYFQMSLSLFLNTITNYKNINQDALNNYNKKALQAIFSALEQGLAPNDVGRLEHWGKTTDGRIVILDYGFTEKSAIYY